MMKKNIIIPTGYMGSGSSAITDLLEEVEGYASANGSYEYVFLHCPNGLFDLEDKLLYGNNALRSDEALHSFFYCMKALYEEKHWWFGDYKRKIGSSFLDDCIAFIDSIVDVRMKGSFWYNQEMVHEGRLERFFNKIKKRINKVGARKLLYNEMWISYPEKEEFYEKSRGLIEHFVNSFPSNEQNIIFDQLVLPHNLFRVGNYFGDNCKVIVVERDPRDVFILNKYYWNKLHSPIPYPFDVKDFCNYYEKMRRSEVLVENRNILRVHFEDMVYNYSRSLAKIFDFLKIDNESHVGKFRKFNPEKSILGTQLYMQDEKFFKEAEYIEKVLSKYTYKFPKRPNNKLTIDNVIM